MILVAISALSVGILGPVSLAPAAEIRCLFPLALQSALIELVPKFEESSGQKLSIDYGAIGGLTGRLQKGEAADVAIVSADQIDDLQKQGKIVAGSKLGIAKVGVGMFVRKGASKPDISSVDAFKRALLAAKSIGYTDPSRGGPAGIYLAGLVDRLGIALDMKPKTKLAAPGAPLYDNVASGDTEIGFDQITQVLAEPRVDLVGPLPTAIQNYTRFAAGLVAVSTHQDLGKALISFLSSPAALAVMETKGFEPH